MRALPINRLAAAGLSVAFCVTAAFAQPSAEQPAKVHVTLLQLNDVYELTPVQKGTRGGLARVATLVKQVEAQNPNTFLVLAGDTLSPSIASRIFQGKQMIDVWNQMGMDFATLGNHEFDYGDAVLKQRMQESQFPWVIANVIDETTGQPFGTGVPYVIKDVQGVKVGFFGLLTPDTKNASKPGPTTAFTDPVIAACETVRKMRMVGAEVIIAVTHLAMPEDKLLARKVGYPRIAAILGGHEHTLLTAMAGGIPIFKVASDAVNLGRLDLTIDAETHQLEGMDWQTIPVTAEVADDPAIAAVVRQYEAQLNTVLGQVIGNTSVELEARQAVVRRRESNLGNYIADAFRSRMQADVALINGGSIRSNTTYGPGDLTRRDVLTILPFGNPVRKVQLSGKVLKDALENGVSRLGDEEAGRFPQISGMAFEYDGRLPAGARVTKVLVNGQPLQPNKLYTLATTSYLLDGGDDYLMLKGLMQPASLNAEAPIEADVVTDAIQQAKSIAPKVDGRIKRLDVPNNL